MTSIDKRLERKDYIANATSPLDQRVKLVSLTQEGRQLANEWRGIMQAMLSRVEEVLTPKELEHGSNAQGRACVPR
jgi:DNA-binding MarR family transcriptional regulator